MKINERKINKLNMTQDDAEQLKLQPTPCIDDRFLPVKRKEHTMIYYNIYLILIIAHQKLFCHFSTS